MQKHSVYLIEAFLIFAEQKNMVKAATLLGISQPALSRQLADFEAQVGQKLFQSKGRQKVLTALGEELFIRLAKEWKNYSSLINETCAQFSDKPTQAIKVYGPYEWVGRMAQKLNFPHTLEFIPTLSEHVATQVEKNEISLGLTRFLPENSSLICKKCFENEFYLMMPKSWKIKSDNFNQKLLQELSSYPRFAFRRDIESQTFIKFKEKINLEPKRILPNWQVLLNLVAEGKGWAIAPSDVIFSFKNLTDKAELIKIPPSIIESSKFYLMYKPELIKIPWFKELTQEILSS
ncbi:LysR family transcriptional regulator [Pseudobdellovibrio sp. HCB154]|uniref:LysR family transcriptional regulator n=1 Tax=Pseudobdellovibrio sp. HCB154 TaxID=3386277 RepID=UPI003916D4BE